MTATPREFLIGLLVAVGLLGASVAVIDYCQAHKGQANQSTADTAKGEAITHEAQARAQDPKAAELQAQLDKREKDLARLMAERDRLLRQRVVGEAGQVPQAPDTPQSVRDDRDDIIAADALVIEAQGKKIELLEEKCVVLTKRGDEWEAACHARERQVKALEVVLSTRPAPRNWSAGARIAQKMDGSRQIGASARRDLGPAYIEVSGFSDRAELGFGWRF